MKYRFLLDENILHFAIKGVDEFDQPNTTSTELVRLIGSNCHRIILNQYLIDCYWHQIAKIRAERQKPRAMEPVAFVVGLLHKAEKCSFEANDCPELPAGVVVPRKDIEIVKIARHAKVRIVTGDGPLWDAVNGSSLLQLQALTPVQAVPLASET